MTTQKKAARLLEQTETAKEYTPPNYTPLETETQPFTYTVCPGVTAKIRRRNKSGNYVVYIVPTEANELNISTPVAVGPAFCHIDNAQAYLDDLADEEGWKLITKEVE